MAYAYLLSQRGIGGNAEWQLFFATFDSNFCSYAFGCCGKLAVPGNNLCLIVSYSPYRGACVVEMWLAVVRLMVGNNWFPIPHSGVLA